MTSIFTEVNHAGFVVRDLDEGAGFLTGILGFERIEGRQGTLGSDEDDRMTRRLGVHPRARGRFAFFRLGDAVVELLEWQAPDQQTAPPKNSDAGGRHLALTVSDMDAAAARLAAVPGVVVREPNESGFRYVTTPFGLEIQLIAAG